MRLIDADALYKYLSSKYDEIEDILEIIENQTTGEDKRSEDYVKREDVIRYICESKECYKDECKGRQYKRCPDILWIYELPSVKI